MLVVCCPTCGFLLADKQIKFENEIKKINNIEKDKDKDKDKDKEIDIEKEKNNIINKLNIKRYCCKLRLLTYYDDAKNLV